MLLCLYATESSDSPLVQHLLSSWRPAWQPSHNDPLFRANPLNVSGHNVVFKDPLTFKVCNTHCNFRANPLNVEYTWFKDGQKIIFGGEKKDRRKRDVKLEHFTADVSTFT